MKPQNTGMYDDNEETTVLLAEVSPLQAVLDALEAFVAADSWAEARRVLEAHPRELLTEIADDVLATLMGRYQDADVVRVLAEHRHVLLRCRAAGIDVAFAELSSPAGACPPGVDPAVWERILEIDTSAGMMDFLAAHPDLILHIYRRVSHVLAEYDSLLLDGLLALLESETWPAAREIVETIPALLSLDAEVWLAQYGAALARDGNAYAVAVVTMRRWLLARCRMSGVGAAFGSRLALWDGTQVGSLTVSAPPWLAHDVRQAA